MPSAPLSVRDAREDDVEAIQAIYAHHVNHGLASFEETPPDVSEIARRYKATRANNLPYLVAELGGIVKGYAYASRFRDRSAYRYTVEDSVYVAPDAVGQGIGSALLAELIARCTQLGYRQMIAVIGDSDNRGSIALHAKHGFFDAGHMPSVGFKFGRWVDSVRMQRALGEGDATPPE